jgi:hypothetical protein
VIDGAFVKVLQQHFHADCFVCSNCDKSLQGKGFQPMEKTFVCEDCAELLQGSIKRLQSAPAPTKAVPIPAPTSTASAASALSVPVASAAAAVISLSEYTYEQLSDPGHVDLPVDQRKREVCVVW